MNSRSCSPGMAGRQPGCPRAGIWSVKDSPGIMTEQSQQPDAPAIKTGEEESTPLGVARFDPRNRLLEADEGFGKILPSSLDGVSSGRLSLFDILARAVAQGHIQPEGDRQAWQFQSRIGWSRNGGRILLPMGDGQLLTITRQDQEDGTIKASIGHEGAEELDLILKAGPLGPVDEDGEAEEGSAETAPEAGNEAGKAVQEAVSLIRDRVSQESKQAFAARMEQSGDTVQLALEALPVAIAVFDPDQALCAVNRQYGTFFGLPDRLMAPGAAYQDILAFKAENGEFATGTFGETDPQVIIQKRLEGLARGDGFAGEYEHSGGQKIETRCVPLPGGGHVEVCAEASGWDGDDWFQEMVRYDDLTGLANRTHFRTLVSDMVRKAGKKGDSGVLLCIKMDNMREVNDFLGYGRGDHVLRSLADRLVEAAGDRGRLARLGDVKFAMLVPGIPDEGAASVFAERLHHQLSTCPIVIEDGLEVDVVCAIGLTRFPDNGTDPNDLIRQAEMALAHAKDVRNRQFSFHSSMREKADRLGRLTHDLRHALERKELRAFYQPKVDMRTGRITGMEALMRWQHPERGMIPPFEFIPVAERTGLIAPLTDWMLREACGQTRAWKDAGIADLKVAVNLSTVHFRRQSVINSVTQALDDTGLDPENLEIEITESVLMAEDDVIKETFAWFHTIGIPIAIDDFGTGYSSLAYLRRFPVDKVKIDASFVMRMHENDDDAAICRAVISLSHSLGMKVVAEGIEEAEHVAALRALDCDDGQGYFFGRPMPAAAFEELLADNDVCPGFEELDDDDDDD